MGLGDGSGEVPRPVGSRGEAPVGKLEQFANTVYRFRLQKL